MPCQMVDSFILFICITVSRNQIFLEIRYLTSCERSDAFKFPLITVVDAIRKLTKMDLI